MTFPTIAERDFQRQITQLAELYGWEWYHVRAGRTADSWRTPGSGTMAKGWPDLCLVHPAQRRLIFAEVKTDAGKLTPDQLRCIGIFDSVTDSAPPIEVYVWRPKFWEFIEEALKPRKAAA